MQYNILHLPFSQSETKFFRGSQHSPSSCSCHFWTSAHTTLRGLIGWLVVKLWTITLRKSSRSLNIVWPWASWSNNSSRNSTWSSTSTYEIRSVIHYRLQHDYIIMQYNIIQQMLVVFHKKATYCNKTIISYKLSNTKYYFNYVINNIVEVTLCSKQLTTDDCFITVARLYFLWNTTNICVCDATELLLYYYKSRFSLNMKCIWTIADYCMYLPNCKSNVTNVPTIHVTTFEKSHLPHTPHQDTLHH